MMNLKKYIWKKMDALYMDWQQLSSLIDRVLTAILGHSVHPRAFEDNGYWEVCTDEITPEEMEKLLVLGNADEKDREDHTPYVNSGKIKDLTAALTIKLLQPELLFPIDCSVPTQDGVYLLNKGISFIKDYEKQSK